MDRLRVLQVSFDLRPDRLEHRLHFGRLRVGRQLFVDEIEDGLPETAGLLRVQCRCIRKLANVRAKEHGIEVNAGHDLDHENLVLFRDLPHLKEVSIGHAIISRAIFDGLRPVVREYLQVLADARVLKQEGLPS